MGKVGLIQVVKRSPFGDWDIWWERGWWDLSWSVAIIKYKIIERVKKLYIKYDYIKRRPAMKSQP